MPRLRSLVLAAAASCAAVLATLVPLQGLTAQAATTPFFGVLEADGSHATAEAAAGLSAAELALNWSAYQPAQGQVSSSYVSSMRSRLQQLRSAGLNVVLDVGLQYPPAWIFTVDANTRFVNQYGDVWHSSLSQDIPNAVFDQNVRNYQAAYVAQVAADLGGDFYAVRAGGLLQDELRYPDAGYNGHTNSYWAFDANAQAHSPVPGWIPGQADSTKAASFLNYYLQSITDYSTWLVSTYRAHFPSPWLQVLYPSWGLRPGDTASSGDDVTVMSTVVQRVRDWGLAGLMWLNEQSLFSASTANLAAYSVLIHSGPSAPPGSPPATPPPAPPSLPAGTSIPTW